MWRRPSPSGSLHTDCTYSYFPAGAGHRGCGRSFPSSCPLLQHADTVAVRCVHSFLQVPDIVDAALREADKNHDGALDLEDFKVGSHFGWLT